MPKKMAFDGGLPPKITENNSDPGITMDVNQICTMA